ncbi:molybdate ABC transporter substrate-binding protein [Corynebacterium uropygiale]|uniref:Molybdate ABC transporter substrate-binding protein n=1 Tax=Corynebacterium uropygiale TaxID=1775911 RepID=A0A9X1QRP3_9CORY|nr:molybdate ABC transporter substrate-binding protein [Corynebacterium uropygiale]MCF4006940.1 molybdate ABC transporter substrate-binding protein [Corynebacterium uropygiale]
MIRSRSLRIAGALLSLGLGAGMVACAPSEGSAPDSDTPEATTLTVLGAASTRVLNDDLSAAAAELDSPATLSFVNAGSSTLVQQLSDGAPGDVLITADRRTMKDAQSRGLVEDPVVAATNEMVLVVPRGQGERFADLDVLSSPETHVVLCDPQVPCGNVAQSIMKENGWSFQPVSLEHSVSDALGKVLSGDADAAFVYRTDYLASKDALDVVELPGAKDFPNELLAARTSSSEHGESAEALVSYLTSPEADALWHDHGFTPSEGSSH